ncbi:MAG: hypothetical protein OXG79_09150 [Chloroflexi bacterium]|nr:hypothetical protein [Chloroflexota bacterium]
MAQLFEKTAEGWQEILPDALDFYTGVQTSGLTWNGTHYAIASTSRLYMFDRSGRRVPSADVVVPSGAFSVQVRRIVQGLTWDKTNSLYWLLTESTPDASGNEANVRRSDLVSLSPTGTLGTKRNLSSGSGQRWGAVIWASDLLNVVRTDGQVRRWTTAQPPVASGSTINLPSGPDNIAGGVFVNSKFLVADSRDLMMYGFTDRWERSSADDFDLTDVPGEEARRNTNPAGVSWDGRFVRVADNNYFRRKVFTYGLDGTYLGAA